MLHYSINTWERFTTVYKDDKPIGTIAAPLVHPRHDVPNSGMWTIANTSGHVVWARKYKPTFSIVRALLG